MGWIKWKEWDEWDEFAPEHEIVWTNENWEDVEANWEDIEEKWEGT